MTTRIDWPRLLEDLAILLGEHGNPCTTFELAHQLSVARGTLRGWIDGSEPKHADGEKLLDRWRALSGKPREFAPLEPKSLSGHNR